MRRVGAWGMAAALVVGFGVAAATAEQPAGDAKSVADKSGWWSTWFGEKPKPKVEKKTPVEDAPAPPTTVSMGIAEQKRQTNAMLRRMEVCDRLRRVALQSGNEELMRQADELEARATEIYRRQIAHLPTPVLPPQAEGKTNKKKSTAKNTLGADGLTDKEFDEPAAKPVTSRQELGGDFKQREQNLINGTFMGRD